MKPPLAIVGASVRAAAASAIRAGYQPVAADLFADSDLRHIATATRIRPYPEGLLDWLRAIEPPAWMYTGALENYPELVDQMAWIAPLLGNPGEILARVRSPWELAETLRSAGLLFPETRASADGLPRDGSWLRKTYSGASGSGVRILGGEPSRGYPAGSREQEEPLASVYQRRVDGIPCAAVYVAAAEGAQLLGITRQLIGEPWLRAHGFQYAGSIGTWPVSEATRATLVRLGNVLSEQFELVGLFGVDFILDGEQVWAVEVNPRYTASVEIVERSAGISAIGAHVAACGGPSAEVERAGASARLSLSNASPPISAGAARFLFHGKATLFANRDVTISQTFADYSITEAIQRPWPMLADVSPAGTFIESGRPILSLFADGSNVGEVEQRLRARVVELENKLYID